MDGSGPSSPPRAEVMCEARNCPQALGNATECAVPICTLLSGLALKPWHTLGLITSWLDVACEVVGWLLSSQAQSTQVKSI